MRVRIGREWAVRLGGAVVVGMVGFVVSVLLDFEPRPWAFAVMVVLTFSATWLLIDTVNTPPARWLPTLPPQGDRTGEASNDLRILSSHQAATEPDSALRDRLVTLARGRDPAVAEAVHAELTPVRRLTAVEIDRILTRIEGTRDHT